MAPPVEPCFLRPAGTDTWPVNVNVVAASNHNLEDLIRKKQFRSDLFFRLDVFRLHLRPLRERDGDVVLLARHFLNTLCAEHGNVRKTLGPATLRMLADYTWPGNVRELYNVLQRAVIFSEGPEILPSHIEGIPEQPASEATAGSFRDARSRAIEAFERHYVEDLMRESGGNVSRAARLAQQDRRSFGRLVKRYNIKVALRSESSGGDGSI